IVNLQEVTKAFDGVIYNAFEDFINNGDVNIFFFKNINNIGDEKITISRDDDRFSFTLIHHGTKVSFSEEKQAKYQNLINALFREGFNIAAKDTVFGLAPTPSVQYFKLRNEKQTQPNRITKIIFQIMISFALSFCLLILKVELNRNKKQKKLIKKFF
ncbi:hypothetical protein N8863_06140, partial [Candidatus Pelagibacter ubique]|nr:hypothetical protein [Candidatus Pelagibacter ubique]